MFFLKAIEVLSSTGWLVVFMTALVAFLILRLSFSGPKNLPPGPSGLSLLCYLPFIINDPVKKLSDFSKKYGDVMRINLFGMNMIHLGSYEAIHEAFVTRGNEFAGRPDVGIFDLSPFRRLGVIFSDGEHWKFHRRFALQTLRDFGFGKLSLEARIQENAQDVVNVLEESKGRPIDVKTLLTNSSANVICSLVFDRHFKLDDPLFVKLTSTLQELLDVPMAFLLMNSFVLKLLPVRYISSLNTWGTTNNRLREMLDEFIKEHQETFDPNFLRDYVDVFLNEMKKNEDSNEDKKSPFKLDLLNSVAIDLFIAGTETTSDTVYWALRYLMYRPEMQKKIQEEIDVVIGRERLPGNKDRMKMPYTEAVILEVLRISSLVPLGAFHRNSEELQLRNYTISKNSFIIPNLWAVHYDPKHWPEPDRFDPTRFLSEDGKVIKKDMLLPFSTGKRVCLGESLARSELFIFLTSIFQHFHIVPPDGATELPLTVHLGAFVRTLNPYDICALKRE